MVFIYTNLINFFTYTLNNASDKIYRFLNYFYFSLLNNIISIASLLKNTFKRKNIFFVSLKYRNVIICYIKLKYIIITL